MSTECNNKVNQQAHSPSVIGFAGGGGGGGFLAALRHALVFLWLFSSYQVGVEHLNQRKILLGSRKFTSICFSFPTDVKVTMTSLQGGVRKFSENTVWRFTSCSHCVFGWGRARPQLYRVWFPMWGPAGNWPSPLTLVCEIKL